MDGGWGGSFIQESQRLQSETRINGIAMVRRSPEKSFFLDFSRTWTSIPTTTCQPSHLESPPVLLTRVEWDLSHLDEGRVRGSMHLRKSPVLCGPIRTRKPRTTRQLTMLSCCDQYANPSEQACLHQGIHFLIQSEVLRPTVHRLIILQVFHRPLPRCRNY